MIEDKIPENDIIDLAIEEFIDSMSSDDVSDDEWDDMVDLLFSVVEDLVIDEKIEDAPDWDSSDEEKKKWVDTHFPLVKEQFEIALSELSDDSDLQ